MVRATLSARVLRQARGVLTLLGLSVAGLAGDAIRREAPDAADSIQEFGRQYLHSGLQTAQAALATNRSLATTNLGGIPALHLAIATQDADLVTLFLAHGADPAATDSQGNTVFHAAMPWGLSDGLLERFLASGANPLATNRSGQTPLHRLQHGQPFGEDDDSDFPPTADLLRRTVAWLVQHGVRPDARDAAGRTALHSAVESGSVYAARLLLDHGCNPRATNAAGWTPLHLAVRSAAWVPEDGDWSGHPNLVLLLLERGAEINARAADGRTPLHVLLDSSSVFRSAWARLLLDHGADPNLADLAGRTSLRAALSGKWPWTDLDATLDALLTAGARPGAPDGEGRAVLHWLACLSDKAPYLSTVPASLLTDAAGLNQPDHQGNTPLHLAAQSGNASLVECLIKHGAATTLTNAQGQTAFSLMPDIPAAALGLQLGFFQAISQGDVKTVEAFLDADPRRANQPQEHTRSAPLEYALWQGKSAAAELLLRRGAELTPAAAVMLNRPADLLRLLPDAAGGGQVSGFGGTLLHLAAERGFVSCMEVLLEQGAALDVVNNEGHTAWFETQQHGHRDAAALLTRRGASPSLFDAAALGLVTPLAERLKAGDFQQQRFGVGRLTALHVAAAHDQTAALDALCRAGLLVDTPAFGRIRALHCAAQSNAVESVRWLVAQGAVVDQPDSLGRTPLHHAVLAGAIASVQALVAAGADINAQPGRTRDPELMGGAGARNSPLHLAAATGRADVVAWLLSKGADPRATNGFGATPLQLAREAPLPAAEARLLFDVWYAAQGSVKPGGYLGRRVVPEAERRPWREVERLLP